MTKTILIGIVLTGIVAGCGIFNSNSKNPFNPSKIRGALHTIHAVDIPCDTGPRAGNVCGQKITAMNILINYPYIYGCVQQWGELNKNAEEVSEDTLKENLKIIHKWRDTYKILTRNGQSLDNNGPLFTIKRDTTGEKPRFVFGGHSFVVVDSVGSINCPPNASYTKKIFKSLF
jgi:hypothetical protein